MASIIDNYAVIRLLNLIEAGDINAARLIYTSFQASVFSFIRLQIRDDQASEEILNDTFMIALANPNRFDGTSTYRTWLCGIAKNLCRNWSRKQSTVISNSSVEFDEELHVDWLVPEISVLSRLEEQEINEVLRECIDKLPLKHREAVYWAFVAEESLENVALQLECPVGTIKSRLFHAKAKLAECMRNFFG